MLKCRISGLAPILLFFLFLELQCSVRADTPANCTYEDIRGTWALYEGERGHAKSLDCPESFTNVTSVYRVRLLFPNRAEDEAGNVGNWTLIYNQGFELVIAGRKYFGFSYYTTDAHAGVTTSLCNQTFVSTSHDTGVDPLNWSCFVGFREDEQSSSAASKHSSKSSLPFAEKLQAHMLYKKNEKFVDQLNSLQSEWRAAHYEAFSALTIADLVRMSGGKRSRYTRPKPAPIDAETARLADALPAAFDWRNVSGVNYVSPVRNQGQCGSCYAFGSMAMHEARLRIRTDNSATNVFSTQDVVECSAYSQGCDGGFPYLVAGKYAEDFGIVDEQCNPYKGQDGVCRTDQSCSRQYATNYRYVGGFYGACNEPLMRVALVRDGPIAVSFQVYDDFVAYKGGVYHHVSEARDQVNFGFNPWEITNHVVLIVGYGVEALTGQNYWIVKNSWGTSWGESGFFRIRRGNDECSIESIAVESDIIV